MNVTPEQVREAVKEHNISTWLVRRCSICDYPLQYVFLPEDFVGFDTGCYCTSGRGGVVPRFYFDVANTFNIQTDEIGNRMWKDFIGELE